MRPQDDAGAVASRSGSSWPAAWGVRLGGREGRRSKLRAAADRLSAGGAAAALGEVAVIAKPDTELPSLPGVTVWIEPDDAAPPAGRDRSKRSAAPAGRPVLVCAADLPFVTPELIGRLARADPREAPGRRRGLPRRDAAAARLLLAAGARAAAPRRGDAASAPLDARWSADSRRGCSRSTTRRAVQRQRSRGPAPGGGDARPPAGSAEREVVGADARGELDRQRVLLGRRAARPASRAAGRDGHVAAVDVGAGLARPGSGGRRAARRTWRGTLPAEVSTRYTLRGLEAALDRAAG